MKVYSTREMMWHVGACWRMCGFRNEFDCRIEASVCCGLPMPLKVKNDDSCAFVENRWRENIICGWRHELMTQPEVEKVVIKSQPAVATSRKSRRRSTFNGMRLVDCGGELFGIVRLYVLETAKKFLIPYLRGMRILKLPVNYERFLYMHLLKIDLKISFLTEWAQ